MINIALFGASGKMGRALIEESKKVESIEINNFIVSESSKYLGKDVGENFYDEPSEEIFTSYPNKPFDCIIDFATEINFEARLEIYKKLNKPLLFCATGINENQLENLKLLAKKFPVFIAPNTSILTALMTKFLTHIPQIEDSFQIKISEKHHKSKIDSPSGTAILLANAVNFDTIKVESFREGDQGNWHKVSISNEFEELELKHSSRNRSIYAQGALNIVKWFYQKPKNLYYMQTLIEDIYE